MEGSISVDDIRGQINFPGVCINSTKASESRRQANENLREAESREGFWMKEWIVTFSQGRELRLQLLLEFCSNPARLPREGLQGSLGVNPPPLASVLGVAQYQARTMEMQSMGERGVTGHYWQRSQHNRGLMRQGSEGKHLVEVSNLKGSACSLDKGFPFPWTPASRSCLKHSRCSIKVGGRGTNQPAEREKNDL